MPTIKFTAPAAVFDFNKIDLETGESGLFVEDSQAMKSLDGLSYTEEAFSDYLADGSETRMLAELGVAGGFLSFAMEAKSQRLLASTEYSSPRPLSDSEIGCLKDYTIGQWSDGIGSNFFQERMSKGLAPQVLVLNEESVQVEQKN